MSSQLNQSTDSCSTTEEIQSDEEATYLPPGYNHCTCPQAYICSNCSHEAEQELLQWLLNWNPNSYRSLQQKKYFSTEHKVREAERSHELLLKAGLKAKKLHNRGKKKTPAGPKKENLWGTKRICPQNRVLRSVCRNESGIKVPRPRTQ